MVGSSFFVKGVTKLPSMSAKRKNLKKTTRKPPHRETLPTYTIGEGGNFRGLTGEVLVKDYQYPRTILAVCGDMERKKFERFVEGLVGETTSEVNGGGEGCLRWVYDHVFFNDGQERYEAADDVSFDVRGSFCSHCELARRLVELRPIAFDTPSDFGKAEFETDGFTHTSWDWFSERDDGKKEGYKESGNAVVEMSPSRFRSLLVMIKSFDEDDRMGIRKCAFSYTCGGRRVYVMERVPIMNDTPMETLDYQDDVVKTIRELEKPRKLLEGRVEVSIMVSEFDPFLSGKSTDHCYYNPRLILNIGSDIVHSLSVKLTVADRTFLFVCPNPTPTAISIDYELTRSLDTFPSCDLYFPAMYYGNGDIGEVLLYSLMFLMGRNDIEFSDVVRNRPEEFYRTCRSYFDQTDCEALRQRLIYHKGNNESLTFPRAVASIRDSLVGLKTNRYSSSLTSADNKNK